LVAYWPGCEIRNTSPVARLRANPTCAHGMNRRTVRSGTFLMKPSRRRSKTPAPPISRHSPMKCRLSESGQSQATSFCRAADSDVAASQSASAVI
jgi:hypothetical protein